jgi:O-acetyl-ADP-ribose deacetylase (regulator of RNase III)
MVWDRISVIQGDITRETSDAIVNAANTALLGGGGVDGAIHRAAGPQLLEECRALDGCPTGEAKITSGYRLPARWVIHTVGPVWHGGNHGEESLLARCYRNSLALARDRDMRSVSFPSISTGAYGFPVARASEIALREITNFLKANAVPARIRIVCFDDRTLEAYRAAQACLEAEENADA